MTSAMLTALDVNNDHVLDLTAMNQADRDAIHGTRAAKRNGHDIVCRQCQRPAHLVINQLGNAFFRHNPGEGATCILSEFGRGESTEHLAAKLAIVQAHRALTGWTAEPERRFEADGELVVVDVFATPDNPGQHRVATAWEVQVSHQPHGTTVERTETRRRLTGARTAWATPHEATLGTTLGIITDPTVTHVIKGLWETPDFHNPLPPMTVDGFIRSTQATTPRLIWAQAGLDNEWVAYPRSSVSSATPTTASRRRAAQALDQDRACERTPAKHASTRSAPTWSTRHNGPVTTGPAPTGDQMCRKCNKAYRDHSPLDCACCGQNIDHHPEGLAECVAGQARMATSRQLAGIELNDIDLLVLERRR